MGISIRHQATIYIPSALVTGPSTPGCLCYTLPLNYTHVVRVQIFAPIMTHGNALCVYMSAFAPLLFLVPSSLYPAFSCNLGIMLYIVRLSYSLVHTFTLTVTQSLMPKFKAEFKYSSFQVHKHCMFPLYECIAGNTYKSGASSFLGPTRSFGAHCGSCGILIKRLPFCPP